MHSRVTSSIELSTNVNLTVSELFENILSSYFDLLQEEVGVKHRTLDSKVAVSPKMDDHPTFLTTQPPDSVFHVFGM